ncbi:MAG: lysostaphin resistance A-like protein [Promethearchaeota archaeon]
MANFNDFLIRHSLIAIIIIMALYGLFIIVSRLLVVLFFSPLPFLLFIWIQFTIVFGTLALLLFIIIPFGLQLPNGKESFKDFTHSIRLSRFYPWKRNLCLGFAFATIFCLCTLCFSLLVGKYIFDPTIIFGWPESNNIGIFLFVDMLIPGIWEEVAFRGIVLTILLKKYSEKKAIIIDGLLFGAMHFLNIIGGADVGSTIVQVAYATTLGFAFAYMYIKTESLIPCIIAHYLIDAVNPLFLNVIFRDMLLALLGLIILIIFLAPLLSILLVKFVMKREKSHQDSHVKY